MSIKLNGGSNPTSVTYNGSTVYKVMYKTSSTATPVAVWAKPFKVTFMIIGGGTVSNYSSDVAFDSEGTRVSNGYYTTGEFYAYYGDTFHVSWDEYWIPTVGDPFFVYEAGSMDIVVTGDVVIDASSNSGGGGGENSNVKIINLVECYALDSQRVYISASVIPAVMSGTATVNYNVAGKTGSVTGNVGDGILVSNTITPSSSTQYLVLHATTDRTETSTYEKEVTINVPNPLYISSIQKASILSAYFSGNTLYYTIQNNNNIPATIEHGDEELWGLEEEEFDANGTKTFSRSIANTVPSVTLAVDCGIGGRWSGYVYQTISNPNYKAPMKNPVLSLDFHEDISTPGGSSSTDDVATFTIINNNNYAVTAHLTAKFHLHLTIQSTQTATVTVNANSTKYYDITGNSEYNSGVEGSCYFSATGVSNSGTVTATAGVIDDETT